MHSLYGPFNALFLTALNQGIVCLSLLCSTLQPLPFIFDKHSCLTLRVFRRKGKENLSAQKAYEVVSTVDSSQYGQTVQIQAE